MKRTLLALLLALTLLLTCAVPVFAEGSIPAKPTGYEEHTLLNQGETVTANKPFLIDLTSIRADFNPDSGDEVSVFTKISGTTFQNFVITKNPYQDRGYAANSSGNQFAYLQDFLVDKDEPLSLVDMTLTEVYPSCQSFQYGLFTFAKEVDAENPGQSSYTLISEYASLWGYNFVFNSEKNLLAYWDRNEDSDPIYINLDAPAYTYSDIVLIFEKEADELPKDQPLAAGETYYHMLWRNLRNYEWGIYPHEPLYAAIGNAADGYKLYPAADLGMNLLEDHYDNPSDLVKLTLAADSPLVGTTYTGQYSADLVEFTASGADSITRVVYYVGNDEAGEYKAFSEENGGAIEAATYRFEDTTPSKGKLSLSNGYSACVTYGNDENSWPVGFENSYPLPGMVLFFETESSGEEEPETPEAPAPSYPQYYPNYDEPVTVQPAPEEPAPEEPAADEYVVVCRRLNVRRTPSTRYARIGRISRGDVVKVVEWVGKWAKIEWKGGTAYVHGNYIAPVD